MKRPFFIVALLFTGGVILGDFFHPPLVFLFFISFLCGTVAMCWKTRRFWFLALLLLFSGWTNMVCQTTVISPNDLKGIVSQTNAELATIKGTLMGLPTEHIFIRDAEEKWRSTAFVEVDALYRNEEWQPACGRVSVSTMGILTSNFFTGQKVEIGGVIRPPAGPVAPGLFDYRNYLKRKGIFHQFYAETNDWKIVEQTPPVCISLADRFHHWAKKTLSLGLPEEDLPQRLIWTLLLDWKAPMTASVQKPFVRAGTFHIFAVDGLRIGMISAMLLLFLKVMRVPRFFSGMIVIPVLWFYVGLTGYPASAIRATIMLSVVIVGWALNRPGDVLNSLFAAVVIILAWDPQQLFQPGFQLSFLVVVCIVCVLEKRKDNTGKDVKISWLKRKCLSIKTHWDLLIYGDPLLPSKLHPFWRDGVIGAWRFSATTFKMSWAAWLGSIPLAAYYFHVFNPVSVLANLPVIPMTMLALISSFGSLLTGAWWQGGAEMFNHSSWLLMKWITQLSEWFSSWPCCYNVATPSLLVLLAGYCVILTIFTGWAWRSPYRKAILGINGVLILLCIAFWEWERQKTCLHVLTMDGGQVVFVDSAKSGESILVDSGDARKAESLTKTFLQSQGVNSISRFCLSHASMRQIGGAECILTNFSVKSVYVGPNKSRSPVYKTIIANPEKRSGWQVIQAGSTCGIWKVLSPVASEHTLKADEDAVVLKATLNGWRVILLSDLNRAGQEALAQRNSDLKAEFLIMGLPTDQQVMSQRLLDEIQPKLIVVADADLPPNRRASTRLREQLEKQKIPVIYCRQTGALTLGLRTAGWEIQLADDFLDIPPEILNAELLGGQLEK